MAGKLSDNLLAISSMLMTATERGELIRLANDLNATIIKAMEIEKTAGTPASKRQAISAQPLNSPTRRLKACRKRLKKNLSQTAALHI